MRRLSCLIATLAVALAACGGDEPPPDAGPPPTSTPTPPSTVGPALVYSTTANCPSSSCAAAPWGADRRDDLWVYEIDTSSHYRLTTEGGKLVEILPQLTEHGTVSFVQGNPEQKPGTTLFELGFQAGEKPKQLFKAENGNVFRYDWHPNGGSVAFLEFDEEGSSALKIWTRANSKVRTVKTFPALLGRGVGFEDEVSVAWSPDGSTILVVDTFRNPPLEVTMWVLDAEGKDVVPARAGTFARWANDSKTVTYKEYSGTGDWFRLSLADDKKTKLAIPNQRLNPAVSPDGKLLALNDGGDKPSVYIFDLSAGKERRIGSGVVPLWISDTAVAVTDVRPCTAAEECFEGPAWKPLGTASKLTVTAAKPEVLFPGWTLNADVRLV